MGLGHEGKTWGMCRNGCPLRAIDGGDVTLDGDIFNRGTGVMTDGGELEGIIDDNDDTDDDEDEGDLVDDTEGERGEKRNNDEDGDDDKDDDEDDGDDDDDDDDGEERDLLVERSTGSVCIWNRSDGKRFSGE